MYAVTFSSATGQNYGLVRPTEQEARLAAIREYIESYSGGCDEVTELLARGKNIVYSDRDEMQIIVTKIIVA